VNSATIVGVVGSKWLLRGNIEGRGVAAHGYYLADPDTQQVEKLKFEETGDKTALMLSPDHTRLVFRESGGAARWIVAAPDGGSAAVPLNTERGELIYGWTADSQSVYVGKPGGAEFQIDRMEVNGSRRTPWKTFHSGRPDVLLANLAVTPDGSAWAYARSHGYDRLVLAQGLA